MGIFRKCKNCGEVVEFVFNKNHKRVPLNIKPEVVMDKGTRKYVQVRTNHFVTCCKDKKRE